MLLGEPAGFEVMQHSADFIIELRDAAVVQIDDLIEVELLPRRALATNDVERIVELCHGEFGFAGIGGIGKSRVPRPFRRKGRMRRGKEDIQEEGLRARGQPRNQPARAASHRGGERYAAKIVQLRQQQPAKTIVREQRDEQAQVLRALADQVLEVPLIFRQVRVIEPEGKLAHVGTAPVGHRGGAIAERLQQPGQRIDPEVRLGVRDEVVADAVGVRPGARQQRNQTRRGAGAGHVTIREQRALRRQCVDIGGQRAVIAQCAKTIGAQGIRTDEKDVGWTGMLLSWSASPRPAVRRPRGPGDESRIRQRGSPKRHELRGPIQLQQSPRCGDQQQEH